MKVRKLIMLILICSCMKPVDSSYARRIKTDIPVFNYQTLVKAIAKGEVLVPDDKTHPLNNIPDNFGGQDALYYLARALDKAMANGEIKWEEEKTNFEMNRLNKLPNKYIRMLGAQRTVISYKKFFRWKQDIGSDLAKYSGNEGQIHFVFDYGIENIARLYDIFGAQYGWNKLYVTLEQISNAVDLFKMNPSSYKGENGQKKLAKDSHIPHPGILYYARDEFEGYSQDDFEWSKNVFTARDLEKIRQEILSLSIESGVNVVDSIFTVHMELFNLAQQYGREEVIAFLKNVGDLGLSFMSKNEENAARLFQLAQQGNWQDIVANYLVINSQIEGCYEIYGAEAKGISQTDLKIYQEILKNLDNEVKKALHKVNDLTITCVLNHFNTQAIVAQVQEDLKIIFNIVSLYKSGELEEEIRLDVPSYVHTFDTEAGDFSEITLRLHDEETEDSEASIRWKIEHAPSEVVSLRLDKDKYTHQVYLDISSSALERMYQILGRKSGHHFEINVPGVEEESMFKILVEMFY